MFICVFKTFQMTIIIRVLILGCVNTLPRIALGNDVGSTWPMNGWDQGRGAGNYYDASISDTGQYQMFVIYEGPCYISSNYGLTFTTAPGLTGFMTACRMNSTGQYMIVCVSSVGLYVSSTYGASFTLSKSFTTSAIACAISASGQYLLIASTNQVINYSVNFGGSWANSTGLAGQNWTRCSINDNEHAVVTVYGERVYYSTTHGSTWSLSNAPISNWYGLCTSSDGQRVTICSTSSACYYSNNYGATFTLSNSAIAQAIACTSDGKYQLAGMSSATKMIFSADYGVTWATVTGGPTVIIFAMAMSGNGRFIIAGGYNGNLYKCIFYS